MGRTHSTNGEKIWWESQKERDHYEDPEVDEMMLKWILTIIG
jgi:hypothetical protein